MFQKQITIQFYDFILDEETLRFFAAILSRSIEMMGYHHKNM
jgi:hypothetical protein